MFSTLIVKELRSILLSPKFAITFGICSILLLLSVYVGIREYRSSVRQYETAIELVKQEMRSQRSWMGVTNRVYRQPDPMQIFSAGVNSDIGRASPISPWLPVKLYSASYTNEPLYAVFRSVDLAFIVSVVLTLFGILFTYDAVNGEREQGTLQLVFSNAVPRTHFVLAKLIGSWLGLTIPLAIPLLLSFSLLIVFNVPMTAEHWLRTGAIIGVSVLVFTFFLAFGILVSSLTHRSNVSFLVCLMTWVLLVLIVPRAGVMIAGQLVSVPSNAEIDSRQDRFAKGRWDEHMKELSERWRGRESTMSGLNKEQRKAKRDEMEWTWAEEDDKARKRVLVDIDENSRKLKEATRNMKQTQERLAFALSRVSPVSAYQLAVMNIAGTDISIKPRYEDAMAEYRTLFNQYRDRKQKESGSAGGIRISFDSNTGLKIDTGREIALDFSDMPQFTHPRAAFGDVVSTTATDVGILALAALLAFAGAFVAFLRYDVR